MSERCTLMEKQRKLNQLAERLVEVRRHQGMGQEEFAALMGTTYRSYQRYEQGYFAPKMAHLVRLYDLGISIDWLLTGQGSMLAGDAIRHDAAVDADLLARLIDGVVEICAAEGRGEEARQPGPIVARLYERLAPIADEGERRGALRYALNQLRDDLRRSGALPDEGL
jgi:transcriptional regulator with XRE-family HTH domain